MGQQVSIIFIFVVGGSRFIIDDICLELWLVVGVCWKDNSKVASKPLALHLGEQRSQHIGTLKQNEVYMSVYVCEGSLFLPVSGPQIVILKKSFIAHLKWGMKDKGMKLQGIV